MAALLRRYVAGGRVPERFDWRDLGTGGPAPALVEFTSPYCHECKVALPVLKAAALVHSTHLAVIDARDRPDLAAKYGVRHTPTILVIGPTGAVHGGWMATPPQEELEAALAAAKSSPNGRNGGRDGNGKRLVRPDREGLRSEP